MPRPNRGPRLVLKAPRGYTAPAYFIRWYEGGRKKEKAIVVGVCVLNRAGKPRRAIGAYIDFYNGRRPHQSLDYKTPDEVYFESGHRPVDMMDKPGGLPTSPQAQQQQSGDKIYLKQAA